MKGDGNGTDGIAFTDQIDNGAGGGGASERREQAIVVEQRERHRRGRSLRRWGGAEINPLALGDLLGGLESAFKVVRAEHWVNGGGARLHPSCSSCPSHASATAAAHPNNSTAFPVGGPWRAAGEACTHVQAVGSSPPGVGKGVGDPSRGNGDDWRSGGLDFDDDYRRLVRFCEVRALQDYRHCFHFHIFFCRF